MPRHAPILPRLGVILAAGLLIAADKSPVQAAFGSTIVSTYPDGRTAELWLKPDGAYTARGRRGDSSGGHWQVDGGKLCLHQSSPLPFGSYCTPIPSTGLHSTWSAKAVTGEPIRVRLVKGRYLGAKPATAGGETPQSGSPQN
ncbi:MAG TPA: hypothetical protein VMU59_07130 [Caulobacteraceae bacterium]|nr:hypothetical protein [Caulobacteraceae bacterium]